MKPGLALDSGEFIAAAELNAAPPAVPVLDVNSWAAGARFALEAVARLDSLYWVTDGMRESGIVRAGRATLAEKERLLAAAEQRRPADDGTPESRLAAYVERRHRSRQISHDEIHAFDVGCPTEARLLLSDIEALLAAAKRFAALERRAHWEPERDMGPGGRWYAVAVVRQGKPSFGEAVDAMGGQA